MLTAEAHAAVTDLTRRETLIAAADRADAVVFALGSDGSGKSGGETSAASVSFFWRSIQGE